MFAVGLNRCSGGCQPPGNLSRAHRFDKAESGHGRSSMTRATPQNLVEVAMSQLARSCCMATDVRSGHQARESRVGASPVLEALTASMRFAAHGRMSIAKKGHPSFVVRWQKETRR
jgi:hypothetical protein